MWIRSPGPPKIRRKAAFVHFEWVRLSLRFNWMAAKSVVSEIRVRPASGATNATNSQNVQFDFWNGDLARSNYRDLIETLWRMCAHYLQLEHLKSFNLKHKNVFNFHLFVCEEEQRLYLTRQYIKHNDFWYRDSDLNVISEPVGPSLKS